MTLVQLTKLKESALHKFIVKPMEEIFQRVVVRSAFWITMQPVQIEAVLKSGVGSFLAKFEPCIFLLFARCIRNGWLVSAFAFHLLFSHYR